MARKTLLLALLCLAMTGAAQAQWKWRDAKGNVQYSDMPPPSGTPEKDILQRPVVTRPTIVVAPPGMQPSAASAPRPAASGPTKAELEAAARQKQEQDSQAAKQKDDERRAAQQRRENCSRAQANLRDLQSGGRITRTNEKGERIYMEDAQIAAEVSRARDLITSECR
ncbi:DUF4124 domain-containing protein [Roseateles sp.]|uniref:DUF4124 domain-containing protein n=1 Tax=Roseateles sp. TaxID=1971397 RepID=UPI003BAA1F67